MWLRRVKASAACGAWKNEASIVNTSASKSGAKRLAALCVSAVPARLCSPCFDLSLCVEEGSWEYVAGPGQSHGEHSLFLVIITKPELAL